jgi:hypothetical protein
MSLSKEEAHRRADQIIQDAEQASIQRRNVKAKHVRMPLLLVRNKQLTQLQPYQRVQLINHAKELALDNPVFNKALYIYILASLLLLKYMAGIHFISGTVDNYCLALLGLVLVGFEIYRNYLIYYYIKQLMQH